jgi:hypothetical protein
LKVTIGEAMTFLVFKKNSSIFRSNFLHALSDPYIRTPRLIYIIITKLQKVASGLFPLFAQKKGFLLYCAIRRGTAIPRMKEFSARSGGVQRSAREVLVELVLYGSPKVTSLSPVDYFGAGNVRIGDPLSQTWISLWCCEIRND